MLFHRLLCKVLHSKEKELKLQLDKLEHILFNLDQPVLNTEGKLSESPLETILRVQEELGYDFSIEQVGDLYLLHSK